MYYSVKTVDGVDVSYDDSGTADGPAVVLLTGWAHDLRLYDHMLPGLAPKHRVIRVNWRGHDPESGPVEDFGVPEQVKDTLGLLDALNVDKFCLVSHSHGGWPALEIVDRLGKNRVLCLLMIDQIMTPAPPDFVSGLQAMQNTETWRTARSGLFEHWLDGSDNQAVKDHFTHNMCGFDYAMWSLSCRVIAEAYATHGSPMDRMKKINSSPPIRHVFSHPRNSPEYRKLHDDFSQNPWFTYADLKGETHFPDIELPDRVNAEVEDLLKTATM